MLVTESSTTPHLLTRRGAIYVRNPGSSDPVPLADQRLLFELTARGERALKLATENARDSATAWRPTDLASWSFLAAVPTGVAEDHRARLFTADGVSRVLRVLYDVYGEGSGRYGSFASQPKYRQHQVQFERRWQGDFATSFQVVVASDDGAIGVGNGYLADYEDGVQETTLIEELQHALRATRDFVLDFNGHGDLRLAWHYVLPDKRHIHSGRSATRVTVDAVVERPAALEADELRDETLVAELVAEVLRAGGLGPADDQD